LEYIEAQKLFDLGNKKLDILIHPESLVHAIIKFKNGLTKFIYHDTSMIIPIANAIFDKQLVINEFIKNKSTIKSLTFKTPNKSNFPIIGLLNRATEHPSTPIIINASNEVLVDHFLRKKVPFLAIPNIIKKILNDRNYTKYAIRNPRNLNQIKTINSWARLKTIEKIRKIYGKNY
jgi:1-deoxy-D-xylulose-5-phosphate reductoisomerase